MVVLGAVRAASRARARVAGGLDRADELVDATRTAASLTVACVGREVHRRLDAVELVQAALDARGARGARHALDVEPDFAVWRLMLPFEHTPVGYATGDGRAVAFATYSIDQTEVSRTLARGVRHSNFLRS